MKRFLSIFLAVSLFFNSGFIFSRVKASVVPVPLRTVGNETDKITACYAEDKYNESIDPTLALQRITALEALKTSFILQQSTDGINEDLDCGAINLYERQLISLRNRTNAFTFGFKIWTLDSEDKSLIKNRIDEIRGGIFTADERINDLKKLLKAFIFEYPTEPVTGVDNSPNSGDANEVRQEIGRAETFKNELLIALRFWQSISDQEDSFFKITSISPSQGKSGDIITINGEGLDKTFGVIFGNQNSHKAIEIRKESIISPNQLKITVPSIKDATGKFDVFVFDEYLNTTKDSNSNDFTYVVNNDNSCKCPPGQVSFRNRCYLFDLSKVNCPPLSVPVCGCDGVTYNNKCEALKAGLKSFVSGACY